MAEFKLRGLSQMHAKLRKMAHDAPFKVGRALFIEANMIMTEAKRDFVPVDLNALRSSGDVEEPVIKGHEVSVRMVFGGPAAPYALAVHEHPSPHSPPSWKGVQVHFSPNGRGPKFLEKPMRARMKGMPGRIAEHLGLDGASGSGGARML